MFGVMSGRIYVEIVGVVVGTLVMAIMGTIAGGRLVELSGEAYRKVIVGAIAGAVCLAIFWTVVAIQAEAGDKWILGVVLGAAYGSAFGASVAVAPRKAILGMLIGGIIGAIVGTVMEHDWKKTAFDVISVAITAAITWPVMIGNERVPVPDWLWLEPDKSNKNHKMW